MRLSHSGVLSWGRGVRVGSRESHSRRATTRLLHNLKAIDFSTGWMYIVIETETNNLTDGISVIL
jgi:hypothetical protein